GRARRGGAHALDHDRGSHPAGQPPRRAAHPAGVEAGGRRSSRSRCGRGDELRARGRPVMRTTPLLVMLATLASATLASTAAPAGAAPTHSTTIAVKASFAQDAGRTLQARRHAGPRPRNPDQIVENIGIDLPADP